MNKKLFLLLTPFLLTLLVSLDASSCKPGWIHLFNGKDLKGWHNPYDHGEARVVNGVIELVADKKFFLTTDKQYSDFIFEGEVKLPKGKANSGFMFRAQKKKDGSLYGYQAEVDGSGRKWSGGLFDEARRAWLHPKKPVENNPYNDKHWKKKQKDALIREGWNKYKIKCKGDRIQIWVNGVLTTDLSDDKDSKGYIGLQHHGEKGQVYKFRNINIKKL